MFVMLTISWLFGNRISSFEYCRTRVGLGGMVTTQVFNRVEMSRIMWARIMEECWEWSCSVWRKTQFNMLVCQLREASRIPPKKPRSLNGRHFFLSFCPFLFFSFLFIYLFLERGEGKENQRERNVDVREKLNWLPPAHAPTRDWACNPGMCPDQESNRRSFPLRDVTQPTEPCKSGLDIRFINQS